MWYTPNSIQIEFREQYFMIYCVKSLLQVKKKTTCYLTFISSKLQIVSNFKNSLFSGISFPKSKLMFVQDLVLSMNEYNWLQTRRASTLLSGERVTMGRQLLESVASPPLYTRQICETFKISGTFPVSIEWLQIYVKGIDNGWAAIFINLLGMSKDDL